MSREVIQQALGVLAQAATFRTKAARDQHNETMVALNSALDAMPSDDGAKVRVLRLPRQRYDEASGLDELDPVTVFLEDFEPGKGQLTVVCWGRAWTHYWGAMGNGSTLASFIKRASTGYIVGKLMLPGDVMLKRAERREARWLGQIVNALKAALAHGSAERAHGIKVASQEGGAA